METAGWKPIDLIVGGMVTAGLAFGVYKFGRLGRRAAGAAVVTDLDSTLNLQDCIALAGRPSELEVAVLPQPDPRCRQLASSLRQSMEALTLRQCLEASNRGRSSEASIRRRSVDISGGSAIRGDAVTSDTDIGTLRAFFSHLCSQTKRELRDLFDMERVAASPDQSPPRRPHLRPEPYYSPLMVERTPPELTRQLQSYRDTLQKWTADSEAKLEKLEQQRMSLSTELHVTREALQTERRHRAEAELRRQRAETQLQDVEGRLERVMEKQTQASQRGEEVERLEQQVQELEEQLEMVYLHNVVTPRHAAHHHSLQQQQLSTSLQEAQDEIQTQQSDLQDLQNEMTNLNSYINKMKKDTHQLAEDNAQLQKQLHAAHQAARHLVALLFERSAGKEHNQSQLTDLLNAPDSDLPLDKLLECVTNLLLHS